ncbi:MAG: aminopeptidase P family protein [Spirochaetales bacterium]|jgi:Xaa-Pro dipeptidase|nr:aminopeptidase P family protein [Spirochaetales bacterium]
MDQTIDQERDEFLRSEIKKAGLGAILTWYPEDIVMSTGLLQCLGINLCLYPASGTPQFFGPANEPEDVFPGFAECHRFNLGPGWHADASRLIGDALARLRIRPDELGIAGDDGGHAMTTFPGETPPLTHSVVTGDLFPSDDSTGGGPQLAPDLFTRLTLTKTSREQAAVRRANDVACIGLEAFYETIRPGATEIDIAAAVEYAIHRCSGRDGSGYARGWAHVQGGENIYWGGTYSRSSGNALAEGDLVIIELATCVDGYWSDLTRTTGVGTISDQKLELLGAVQDAQKRAIEAIRPGASHESIHAAARDSFAEKNLAEGFPHNCGHHVGFRYHDRGPTLIGGNPQPIEAGMVLTVEPGTYGREYGGGARFEDDVLVEQDGCTVLSKIDLQPY